jgi:hypothetical protein
LHLTDKESGRITIRTFSKLYQHYKNDFDLELMLKATNTTYAKAQKKQMQSEEWF